MDLDNIDKQIINILFKNGRESLTNIGESVKKTNDENMSHAGIKKRLNKLISSETLKIQTNVNPNVLGHKICFILLEMRDYNEVKKIVKNFSECPRVFLLSQLTGQYNVILGVIGQSLELINNFINFCGPTNKDGILHSQILLSSDFIVPKFLPINLFSQKSNEKNCDNICKECDALLNGECTGCGNF